MNTPTPLNDSQKAFAQDVAQGLVESWRKGEDNAGNNGAELFLIGNQVADMVHAVQGTVEADLDQAIEATDNYLQAEKGRPPMGAIEKEVVKIAAVEKLGWGERQ